MCKANRQTVFPVRFFALELRGTLCYDGGGDIARPGRKRGELPMKRMFGLLAAVLTAAAVFCAACAPAAEPPADEPAAADDGASAAEESVPADDPAAAAEDIAAQTELIAAASAEWYRNEGDYFYTVTDLDHNGRLELIAAACQGTGLFTTAEIYEVAPDKASLVKCADNLVNDGDAYPDMIKDGPCDVYTDGTAYYYIISDVMRSGAAGSSETVTSLCLQNGFVSVTRLFSRLINAEDGTIYIDEMTGNAASAEQFANAAALVYGKDCELQQANFLWSRLDGGDMQQQLTACRDAFLN